MKRFHLPLLWILFRVIFEVRFENIDYLRQEYQDGVEIKKKTTDIFVCVFLCLGKAFFST